MTKFGDQLRKLRRERGMSQEDLAKLLGTSKQVISRYETGQRSPKITVASDYAMKLGIPLSELEGSSDSHVESQFPLPSNLIPIAQMPHHRVPLIGSVAAGEPIIADQQYDVYVDSPDQADYALTIEGDSMEPLYQNGDVVYIKCQDDVDDGRIAVVLLDDSAALQHIYHAQDGLLLVSENAKYPPRLVSFSEYDVIRILGIVVGYTRMYRKG